MAIPSDNFVLNFSVFGIVVAFMVVVWKKKLFYKKYF